MLLIRAMQQTRFNYPMLVMVPQLSVPRRCMKMLWATSVRSISTVFLIFCLLHGVHLHPDNRDFASDTTPHTWTAPTSVDPTSVDAPYSSYAVNSEGTTTLSAPGVYENAWDHLGTIFRRRNLIGSNLLTRVYPTQTQQPTLGNRLRMWTRLRWMLLTRAMPPTPFSSQTIQEATRFHSVAVPRPRPAPEFMKMP